MSILPRRFRSLVSSAMMKRSWALSQAGQDQWVFGEVFNESKSRFFLDIGAHDGLHISNTYVLERRYKWTGLCIEANPITFKALKKNRRSICINTCLDKVNGEVDFAIRGVLGGIVASDMDNSGNISGGQILRVKTRPLTEVLIEHQAPMVIDYLSIDVEGAEDRVLESFAFDKYRFNCITIERPSPNLRTILEKNEYIIVKEIEGLDCFYIHACFLEQYKHNLFKFYEKKQLFYRWY